MFRFFILITAAFYLFSCAGRTDADEVCIVGDTLDVRHASFLQITECEEYTVADIRNPWNDGLMQRYLLVPRNAPVPHRLPHGTLLRTPLEKVLLFSTLHTELLAEIGCVDAIAGICDAEYITRPEVCEKLNSGSIADCGSSVNVNQERIVQLSPDAAWVLPFENGGYGVIEKLHLPLVECADYMETSPLGCAEWIRFYGRLMGRGSLADSLFLLVERNYMSLRDSLLLCPERPSLLCELKSSSAWYVPAGGSTMGRLYSDAAADYLFADNKTSGSVPLAFETILEKGRNASFWLIKYGATKDKTYKSLQQEFDGYKYFKPFVERNIYACNVSKKRFYEETPFRPDILLRELAAIFHPALFPDYQLRYYEKMREE